MSLRGGFPSIPLHVAAGLMNPPPPTAAPQAPSQSAPAQAPQAPVATQAPLAPPIVDNYAPEDFSEIRIHVRVPLTIRGSGNLVTIDNSKNGNRLALGMVNAINQLSQQAMGLPMIDEEGRPRPIKCDIDADIIVDGNNNVIGVQAVEATIDAKKGEAAGETRNVGQKREREDEDIGIGLALSSRVLGLKREYEDSVEEEDDDDDDEILGTDSRKRSRFE